MATSEQTSPINVQNALGAARAERAAVQSREVERDPGILTEVDLLFALEAILERADKALRKVEHALSAVDMAIDQAPEDSRVVALKANALASLARCQQWVADTVNAVMLCTQRLAQRRQAAMPRPKRW